MENREKTEIEVTQNGEDFGGYCLEGQQARGQVVSAYCGYENRDQFRLVRFKKNGIPYSGIEVKKRAGWSIAARAKRDMEPAMWESYWLGSANGGSISIQEAVMRIYVYMVDRFGSMEDILVNGECPVLADAIRSTLRDT